MVKIEQRVGTDVLDDRVEDHLEDEENDSLIRQRKRMVLDKWRQYKHVMEATGFQSSTVVRQTEQWIDQTKWTTRNDINNIQSREEFFEKQGGEIIKEGIPLADDFYKKLAEATPYISKSSRERWIARFKDPSLSVGFQAKRYWIKHQFPYYIKGMKKVYEEREAMVKNPKFDELIKKEPKFAFIKNREGFLQLHFDERKGLIAKAQAALKAVEKGNGDLYKQAEKILVKAAKDKVMASGHVGLWMKRIFGGNHKRARIEQFLTWGNSDSLFTLIGRWTQVKQRYDKVSSQLSSKGKDKPRGLHVPAPAKFLNMHYEQRLSCVAELEHRLADSRTHREGSPQNDPERHFMRLRHNLDVKDWEAADEEIASVSRLTLSDEQKARLRSMKEYLAKFRTDRTAMGLIKKDPEKEEQANKARVTINETLSQLPPSLQPMIMRLLRGPFANRSIHQFRWMVYNNLWCRKHNFLNDEIARQGASDDNKELTKQRALRGEMIGRHDVIDEDTASKAFMEKEKYAKRKATYYHINTASSAVNTLEEKLKGEIDPMECYWSTICFNENGVPYAEGKMHDMFTGLTTLRSATKTLQMAGFMYNGPASPLTSLN